MSDTVVQFFKRFIRKTAPRGRTMVFGYQTTMPEPEQQTVSPFGEWVLKTLRAHDATYRSQRIRTGIPHSTVVGWVQGIPPKRESVVTFARGFDQDVSEALRLAGYVPLPGPTTIREMMDQRQAQESPRERYERQVGAGYVKYSQRGYKIPALGSTRFAHGGHFESDDDADAAYAVWLENLALDNPDQPEPEELTELRERLSEEP